MPILVRDSIATWSSRKRATVGAAVILAVVALNMLYTQRVGQRHDFFDLHVYAGATRQWWHGGDLYDYGRPDDGRNWGFTYPPFAAIIMAPMAVLPWGAITVIQALASALATTLILALLLRRTAKRLGWWLPVVVAGADVLLLPFEPWDSTLSYGQVNILLLALVAIDLLVGLPRQHVLTGIGIGVATAVKLTPAIFIAYLLIIRQWRAALTASATAALVTLVSAAVAPHSSVEFWTSKVFDIQRIGEPSWTDNQSLNGTMHRVDSHDATILWAVAAIVVLAVWLWRIGRKPEGVDPIAGFALTAVVACLVSPMTWVYHLVWLIPALVVLVNRVAARDLSARQRRVALAGLLVAYGLLCSHLVWRTYPGALGFLTANMDVLVSLGLLVGLPVRRQEQAPVTAPVTVAASPDGPWSTIYGSRQSMT
ncbi:glycosyltransferase 87 family protein [Actinoplanes sp. NPDC026619]|uniref:glycosyltransferase 87 family protein n=1 Tax=Actinoplanes sp. NPDC026619 TaxID=3155798 RepID=UPI0033DE6E58